MEPSSAKHVRLLLTRLFGATFTELSPSVRFYSAFLSLPSFPLKVFSLLPALVFYTSLFRLTRRLRRVTLISVTGSYRSCLKSTSPHLDDTPTRAAASLATLRCLRMKDEITEGGAVTARLWLSIGSAKIGRTEPL